MGWVLDPLSIATSGYVVTNDGCPSDIGIGTHGYVDFDDAAVTKGGDGGQAAKDELIRRRHQDRRKQLSLKKQRDPDDISDLIFPQELSEITKELVTKRKVFVGTTEIDAGSLPNVPELPFDPAVELSGIKSDVDREIATLIRTEETRKFREAVKRFQEEILRFEEEFLMFLILLDE